MSVLGSIFTWWNGATFGTRLGLRGKTRVGDDALGNVYYQGGKDTNGWPRRWVIYSGSNDASRVAPEWFSWLHHQVDDLPDRALPPPRAWEKPAVAQSDRHHSRLSPARCARKGRPSCGRHRRL